jgi:hypothetical protein
MLHQYCLKEPPKTTRVVGGEFGCAHAAFTYASSSVVRSMPVDQPV